MYERSSSIRERTPVSGRAALAALYAVILATVGLIILLLNG
jgi:hypothetical protein